MNKQTEHGAGSAHLRKAAERTINGLCRQIGLGHAMPPRYVRAITPGANASDTKWRLSSSLRRRRRSLPVMDSTHRSNGASVWTPLEPP